MVVQVPFNVVRSVRRAFITFPQIFNFQSKIPRANRGHAQITSAEGEEGFTLKSDQREGVYMMSQSIVNADEGRGYKISKI